MNNVTSSRVVKEMDKMDFKIRTEGAEKLILARIQLQFLEQRLLLLRYL